MNTINTITLSLILSTPIYSQQNGVTIIEEKGIKKHFIYAQNSTNEPRSVFLKINATGYRRSADRPLIKTIKPKSKTLLTTLIPLKDTINRYTYIYTVNKEKKDLKVIRAKHDTYYDKKETP